MRIRMISTAAGPRLPHGLHSGHVYDVSEELAEELIGIRAAEAAPAAKTAEPAIEVASVDDGEKSTLPGTEKKSESLMDQLTKSQADGDGKNDEPEQEDEGHDGDEAASDDADEGKQASTPRAKKSAKSANKS